MAASAAEVSLQPSLFGATETSDIGVMTDVSCRERVTLSAGAWIDHQPGWFHGADDLCIRLLRAVPWRAEQRPMYDRIVAVPRLTCFYDAGAPLPDARIEHALQELSAYYEPELGQPLLTTGMCLYRDGHDSVAWHSDSLRADVVTTGELSWTDASRYQPSYRSAYRAAKPGELANTVVAIVSLGSPRTLMLRPKGGGASRRFQLGHGDLLVMGGACQQTWEHAVPKTARVVGPRISIQFRPRNVV